MRECSRPSLQHELKKSSCLKSPSQGKLERKNGRNSQAIFKCEVLKRKNLKVVESFRFPKCDKLNKIK